MINTSFNSDTHIITSYLEGDISIFEILDYIDNFSFSVLSDKDILLLGDLNKAEFTFKPSEIALAINRLQYKVKDSPQVRIAFLSRNPKETAYSLIATRLLKGKGIYCKVFSTEEAAIHWLRTNILIA